MPDPRGGDFPASARKVPHSPQRPAGTVGLVLERKRLRARAGRLRLVLREVRREAVRGVLPPGRTSSRSCRRSSSASTEDAEALHLQEVRNADRAEASRSAPRRSTSTRTSCRASCRACSEQYGYGGFIRLEHLEPCARAHAARRRQVLPRDRRATAGTPRRGSRDCDAARRRRAGALDRARDVSATGPSPTTGSTSRASSTTTSPRWSRRTPSASSASARCRCRRRSWRCASSSAACRELGLAGVQIGTPRQRVEPERPGALSGLRRRGGTGRRRLRASLGHDGRGADAASTGCPGWSGCRPKSRSRSAR